MDITLDNNQGQAILTITGRLDTSVIQQATETCERLLAEAGPISNLACQVAGLTYISSSGLRLLLQLAKKYKDFCILEAQPDVYQVFDVTGFTKMMKVEKALRTLCVDGCDVIGRGGVGVVYRLDDDTIIKVFREGSTIQEVQKEISMSKEAFVLGMPTAISFDVVRVGNSYGLVYELLRADTLSSCIKREPERMDEFARKFAMLFRQLHDIHVPHGGQIPDALKQEEIAIRHISRYFDTPSIDLLLQILHAIPQGDRLLHCDLQTKNAMVQDGELMLIDMGEVGYGHPMLDLGHAYSALVSLLGDYETIIGMPYEYGQQLWQKFMHYYFEGESEEMIAHREEQLNAVSCIRNFSWLSLSDSFPESIIWECQQAFGERVTKRKDHLLRVCSTFNDWKI
ncbi:MAG: STAS domain-containing protein [Bacteroidales bacterium]|nr:STAS domain-containing protein [Bacteroidales bacterium]